MPCMSDVIFIDLLSVLISIYHFGKIIFTEQAELPFFSKEKSKVREDILKDLLSRCYFCLKFCFTSCGIVGMTELASLIFFLLFLCPLMLTLPLLKMLILLLPTQRNTLFLQVLLFIWVSQKDSLAHFFPYFPFSEGLFPSQRVGRHLRGLPRTISISNLSHQQLISIHGQIWGSSVFVNHKVNSLFPSSASSRNQGQLCLSHLGWRV